MDEKWMKVDWAPRYEVSNLGNVRSLPGVDSIGRPRRGKKITSFRDGKKGYRAVEIGGERVKVHRLVCEVFLGKPQGDANQVNHIDGKRDNNRLENLEWCTASQNSRHSFDFLGRKSSGGHKGKFGVRHHCSIPVVGRRVGQREDFFFESAAHATHHLGLSGGSVSRCCHRISASTKGWEFRHAVDMWPDDVEAAYKAAIGPLRAVVVTIED